MKIMPMSTYKTLLPLSCAILFGAMGAGQAAAQGLPPPFTEYAAKFACGPVQPVHGGGDADAVIGVYATSINIHNPQAHLDMKFLKKAVLANQEGTPFSQIRVFPVQVLPPDQAERVDCPMIFKLFGISPQTHIEGFVVIEIPPSAAGTTPLTLDVVGKYSARPANGQVSAFDVVVYNPKEITQ
jgi:hypothetical protein